MQLNSLPCVCRDSLHCVFSEEDFSSELVALQICAWHETPRGPKLGYSVQELYLQEECATTVRCFATWASLPPEEILPRRLKHQSENPSKPPDDDSIQVRSRVTVAS